MNTNLQYYNQSQQQDSKIQSQPRGYSPNIINNNVLQPSNAINMQQDQQIGINKNPQQYQQLQQQYQLKMNSNHQSLYGNKYSQRNNSMSKVNSIDQQNPRIGISGNQENSKQKQSQVPNNQQPKYAQYVINQSKYKHNRTQSQIQQPTTNLQSQNTNGNQFNNNFMKQQYNQIIQQAYPQQNQQNQQQNKGAIQLVSQLQNSMVKLNPQQNQVQIQKNQNVYNQQQYQQSLFNSKITYQKQNQNNFQQQQFTVQKPQQVQTQQQKQANHLRSRSQDFTKLQELKNNNSENVQINEQQLQQQQLKTQNTQPQQQIQMPYSQYSAQTDNRSIQQQQQQQINPRQRALSTQYNPSQINQLQPQLQNTQLSQNSSQKQLNQNRYNFKQQNQKIFNTPPKNNINNNNSQFNQYPQTSFKKNLHFQNQNGISLYHPPMFNTAQKVTNQQNNLQNQQGFSNGKSIQEYTNEYLDLNTNQINNKSIAKYQQNNSINKQNLNKQCMEHSTGEYQETQETQYIKETIQPFQLPMSNDNEDQQNKVQNNIQKLNTHTQQSEQHVTFQEEKETNLENDVYKQKSQQQEIQGQNQNSIKIQSQVQSPQFSSEISVIKQDKLNSSPSLGQQKEIGEQYKQQIQNECSFSNLHQQNQKIQEQIDKQKYNSKQSNDLSKIQKSETEIKVDKQKMSPYKYNTNNYSIDQFQIIKQIGKGKFKKVYLAQYIPNNCLVALSVIDKQAIIIQKNQQYMFNEIKIQSAIHHPNVIQLYGVFSDDLSIYMIQEYAENGDLYKLMKKQPLKRFSERQAANYLFQIIVALQYLHQNNIIHRDLKPENILLSNGVAKLADFGCCNIVEENDRSTFCGTLDYLSPELVQGDFYNYSVDIWTFGILTYELITGNPPFKNTTNEDTFKDILNINLEFPSFVSDGAKQFINSILVKDPKKRLTIEEILNDQWLLENSLEPNYEQNIVDILDQIFQQQ